MPAMAMTAQLSGTAKLEEVTKLMHELKLDLAEKNLLPPVRNAKLERVKIYARKVDDAGPVYSKEGIETLTRHSFDGNSPTTSREALRGLANALLLNVESRQYFVDLDYAWKAAEKLKIDNRDDEFLGSRILFLMTYDTNLDFNPLFDKYQLGDSINANIARHSKSFSKGSRKSSNPMDEMALSETLKLIFNITQFYPQRAEVFTKSIPHILKMLSRIKIPHPPLQPPVNYLINSLINLDLEGKKNQQSGTNPLFPKFDQNCNADHLINVLDAAVCAYDAANLEQLATPLVTLLRKIYSFAPDGVKRYMRWLLLPSDDERIRPLGRSETLASRLLRLSTATEAPNLRESISNLMFELSDQDATSFVKNVGYGFASGFLMAHEMPAVPRTAAEAWSIEGKEGKRGLEYLQEKNPNVNPITGQRLDMEPVDTEPEMTELEKEREAEKLFVLFERLKATGVIDVKNPVEQAIEDGRFEELD